MEEKEIKKKAGRPKKAPKKPGPKPKINEELEKKLLLAFAFDCTDEEACYYAEISTRTLTRYKVINPKFVERINLQRNRPVMAARQAVIASFPLHPDIAFRYLEKKRRDEFGSGGDGSAGTDFITAIINAAKNAG